MSREGVGADKESAEASQLLHWLDEERRRDKAQLVALEQRVEEQTKEIAYSQRSLKELQDRLDQAIAEVKSVSRFDEALQRTRDEILAVVRGFEERLAKEADDADRRLVQEAQSRMEAVGALNRRIEQLPTLEQHLQTRKAEIERLNKSLLSLQSQIEGAVKETKAQHERLLGLGERVRKSEESIAAVPPDMEQAKARFASVEENLKLLRLQDQQAAQRVAELETAGQALTGGQAELSNELRRVDDRGKKQISSWSKELASWRAEAQRVAEQIAKADRQRRESEQMLAALDALRIQLEKDRESLQHMERTAEERQRQQLEEWRKENELLWLANDERWQQLSQDNAKRDDHMQLLWETQLGFLRRDVTHVEKYIKELEKRLLRPKR
jgi:chromosome segregation ATPase